MPSLTHDVYAEWVRGQFRGDDLTEDPGQWIRKHRDGWRNVFSGVAAASAVFELAALVISRWEFLGSLFRGNTGATSSVDAIAYADKFLTQVNPLYAGIHNLTNRANHNHQNQSDLFQMFRNAPLHGAHSSAIELPDHSGVIGWMIGVANTGGTHLSLNADGNVHVSGTALAGELCDSMTLFAEYLDRNLQTLAVPVVQARLPRERWLRAHWARYLPKGMLLNNWMALGYARGIPR